MNKNYYVAIMAGGIGSRFWPVSRAAHPKQFLDLLNTGKSLLQSTYDRYAKFIPQENIFIITFSDYTTLVKQQLPQLPESNVLSEPSRKSTAACVAYMAFKLRNLNPDANFVVAPSDHLILQEDAFADACLGALQFCDENPEALITLGIKPTYPNTGYGYIQYLPDAVSDGIYKVKTFTEKPTLEIAQAFLSSGDFLWNAGIFIWKSTSILAAFEKYLPEMYDAFAADEDKLNTPDEQKALQHIYPQCISISIDYGIMEKSANVFIIPSSFGWSDLGTWNSAYENMDKDYLGNAVKGNNVLVIDATRNMVHSNNHKLVVLQGLDDFVVVDTNDVLLICKKEKEQDIKEYMAEAKRLKGDKFM